MRAALEDGDVERMEDGGWRIEDLEGDLEGDLEDPEGPN